MRKYTRGVIIVVAIVGLLAVSAEAGPTTEWTYDWSTANASPGGVVLDNKTIPNDNNDSWSNIAGLGDGRDDFVYSTNQPPQFSGNYYGSTGVGPGSSGGDDLYERLNDSNFSYSIPSGATSVTLSLLYQADDTMGILRCGLRYIAPASINSCQPVNMGWFGDNEWGVRGPAGIITSTATGAAVLTATPQVFRATLTVDMTPVGSNKLVDLVIENLSASGSETIFDDVVYDIGPVTNPANWNGLYIRIADAKADDITISYVPEPASMALLGIGGLAMIRRRRSR